VVQKKGRARDEAFQFCEGNNNSGEKKGGGSRDLKMAAVRSRVPPYMILLVAAFVLVGVAGFQTLKERKNANAVSAAKENETGRLKSQFEVCLSFPLLWCMSQSIRKEGSQQASNLFLSLECIAVRLLSCTDRGVSSRSACMHAGGG
jgi:hypothetical protein